MEKERSERLARRSQSSTLWRTRQGETADSQHALIYANIGDAAGAQQAGSEGAEGIGLLRTEFLFNQRTTFPDEQEQFTAYLEVFSAFGFSTTVER